MKSYRFFIKSFPSFKRTVSTLAGKLKWPFFGKINNNQKLQGLYILCHLALWPAFVIGSFSWWLISLGCYLFLQCFGLEIGLHRYFAHKSFVTGRMRELFLSLASVLTGMGSPISWAGIHRLHHRHADTEKDPHSPYNKGILHILFGSYNKHIKIPLSMTKDLLRSPVLVFFHRNYFKVLFLWAGLLFILGGWKALIFIFCLPLVMVYWATSSGIILNHTLGYRNFETNDQSVNSYLLSFYTLGGGWHNNHHHNPENYSHRYKWWELDFCGFCIKWLFMPLNRTLKQTTEA